MPATDADEVVPDEATPADASAEPERVPRQQNTPLLIAAAAAALFAVVAIVLVVVLVRDRGTSESNGDRTEISTTAARVAEAITAMDGSGNGTLGATVDQLGTAPVVAQYKEISDAIRKVMGPLKLKSIRGTVKEVYVGDVENAESRVIVRLDLVYVGDNTRVIPDQYLDMTLAKLNGAWKVDNVQVLTETEAVLTRIWEAVSQMERLPSP